MTPGQLSKSGTEHAHQVALFAWAAVARLHGFHVVKVWAETGILDKAYHEAKEIPCLKWLHAIHNQGHGDAIRGGRAKAEGLRAGIPDIFLPYPVKNWTTGKWFNGLYIELKKPSSKPIKETSKGPVSDEQIEFGEYAIANGYQWKVAYGWSEAAKIIQDYLS
jgi:hypothetical protein